MRQPNPLIMVLHRTKQQVFFGSQLLTVVRVMDFEKADVRSTILADTFTFGNALYRLPQFIRSIKRIKWRNLKNNY